MSTVQNAAEAAEYRIEHDTMGEVKVPVDALWRAQTQRAVENFPISGSGLESTQIAALARIKKAAALANKELAALDAAIAASPGAQLYCPALCTAAGDEARAATDERRMALLVENVDERLG